MQGPLPSPYAPAPARVPSLSQDWEEMDQGLLVEERCSMAGLPEHLPTSDPHSQLCSLISYFQIAVGKNVFQHPPPPPRAINHSCLLIQFENQLVAGSYFDVYFFYFIYFY